MAGLTAEQVAALLREYGQRLALRGGNPYRARAYQTASEQVAMVGDALGQLVERRELTGIPAVGDAIAELITRLYRAGTDPKLEEMRKDVPAGVLEIVGLPGIRAEEVLKLYEQAGISDLASLEAALRSGALEGQKGFTRSFQAKLLRGLEIHRRHANAVHISRGWALAEGAKRTLGRSRPELRDITIAGDCRRGCELISDIVLLAVCADGKQRDDLSLNPRITVQFAQQASFGAALLFATGSTAHTEALQQLARTKDMRLDRSGLAKRGRVIAARSEDDIYRALGLPYIAPELREGRDPFTITSEASSLVAAEDKKGVLHAHTKRSDGADTLEAMAEAARQRGYQYFGVTDHSQSAHYAGGLAPAEIEEQKREADGLNCSYAQGFRIFKGIESDIRPDGSLDYPDDILAGFDFIIASVHSQFKMEAEAQTARIIRAIEHPYTTILGHMTGRQLLRRAGYELDIEAVLKACGRHGVAVEVNCNPWRLDIDWRWHQLALNFGCMMSINPDAHSTGEIDMMRWGVAIARKGGVPADRVLTTLDVRSFADYLALRRRPDALRRRRTRRVEQDFP
jgi:DNA polymerase (family 10)